MIDSICSIFYYNFHLSGPICSLLVSANGSEFTSCSEDGSAIFWDMNTLLRKRVIQAPCILRSAAYFPVDESQIVTTSEERQVGAIAILFCRSPTHAPVSEAHFLGRLGRYLDPSTRSSNRLFC